ncbi:hypothetical protein NMG60_11013461 [Bertholletia excelsa]
MGMDPNPPVIAKKLWNIARIVFMMLRKEMNKSKLVLELEMMLKRGKLAGKALGELMLHQHAALSCRSDDIALSFISPREYEFSCSNSPAYPSYLSRRKNHLHFHPEKYFSGRKHHVHFQKNQCHHRHQYSHNLDDVRVVQKVFDMLNREVAVPEASPLVLPGFGRSPAVRQLRVTDSPFPIKDGADEDSCHVDKAAEEFIKRFKAELSHQKQMAALESPSPYHIRAR